MCWLEADNCDISKPWQEADLRGQGQGSGRPPLQALRAVYTSQVRVLTSTNVLGESQEGKGERTPVCKRGPGKGDLASEYWAQPAVWGKVKSEEIFSFVRNETKIHLGPFKLENALNLGEGKTKGLLGQLWIVGYDQG